MFVRDERASATDDDAGDSIEHQPHWTTRRERIRDGNRLRGYLLAKIQDGRGVRVAELVAGAQIEYCAIKTEALGR